MAESTVWTCTYAELLEQNRTIAQNNAELIHRYEELEKQLSASTNHTHEEDELRDKLSNAGAQILVLKSDLQTECDKLKVLTAENKDLSEINKRLCDLHQNISEKNKSLETLNKNLSEEKSYLENFNHDISVRNDILKDENQKLSEKARMLGNKNNEPEYKKRQTEREIEELKIKLRERDFRIQNFQEELGKLRRGQKLCDVDLSEVSKLKRELQSKEKALDAEINMKNELVSQIKTLKMQVESLQRQLADHTTQLETKSNSIAALQKLLLVTEHKEQRTEAAVKMLRLKVDSMGKEKEDLSRQLGDKQAQIETLSSVADMKSTSESVRYERFLESNRELESKIEKLKKQLKENAILMVTQKEKIFYQQILVGLAQKSLTKEEANVKKLESEAKEKNAKLKILEDDINEKNGKLKELEVQLRESATLPPLKCQNEENVILRPQHLSMEITVLKSSASIHQSIPSIHNSSEDTHKTKIPVWVSRGRKERKKKAERFTNIGTLRSKLAAHSSQQQQFKRRKREGQHDMMMV